VQDLALQPILGEGRPPAPRVERPLFAVVGSRDQPRSRLRTVGDDLLEQTRPDPSTLV
jgi:hypothetical protein